jgi:hypothetical protein
MMSDEAVGKIDTDNNLRKQMLVVEFFTMVCYKVCEKK